MTNLSHRLDRIEKAIIPKERVALCFGRLNSLDADCERQHEEYRALHGVLGSVIFYHMQDYCGYEDESYEDFIKRSRKNTGKGNSFCWWIEPLVDDIEEGKSL